MQIVMERKSGLAIGMKEAMKGLNIIAENIGNKTNGIQNYTDFYVVVRSNKKQKEEFTMIDESYFLI